MSEIKRPKPGCYLYHKGRNQLLGVIDSVKAAYFTFKKEDGEIVDPALDIKWFLSEGYSFHTEKPKGVKRNG